jgi:hydrogenase maturation protein HypF
MGIVQGVGFRPFAAKLQTPRMKGEVLNIGGLVDIALTDTPERIEAFVEALKREKPLPAEIVHIKMEETEFREFSGFTILDSAEGDDEAAMIPADLSVCPECFAELQDPENPRYMHPFISCMACGPRYTIIDRIPYDRDNTTMIDFPMCEFCHGEYTNREDRRYHAQTVSCHDCGPMLEYRLSKKKEKREAAAIGIIV